MSEIIVRIDDRLIHGQVIVGWVHRLNLKRIIIANNSIIDNAMRKRLMLMPVPNDITVEFLTLDASASLLKENAEKNSGDKDQNSKKIAIMLFENTQDVVECVKQGAPIDVVNVGGLHYQEGKRQLAPFFSVSDDDIEALRYLLAHGIELEGRAQPTDEKIDVVKLIGGK